MEYNIGDFVIIDDDFLDNYLLKEKYSGIPVCITGVYYDLTLYQVKIPYNSNGTLNVIRSCIKPLKPLSAKQRKREEVIRLSEIKHKITLISI